MVADAMVGVDTLGELFECCCVEAGDADCSTHDPAKFESGHECPVDGSLGDAAEETSCKKDELDRTS